VVITIITAVLLGLTWLYVNYGMALFLVAAVLIWLAGLSAKRRTDCAFSSDALPPPGAPRIGRSSRALTTRPALPDRSRK
jgi:hypothetical protein